MRPPISRRSASIWVSPVLQVRELDLHRPFARARALAEDVEDEPGAVDDLAAPLALEVALLHRAERGVHHGESGRVPGDRLAEGGDLALAEQGGGPVGAHG